MNIRDFLKNIPPEEIERRNKNQINKNAEEFKEFKDAYFKNCCSLCGNKLDYFNKNESCYHWFLLPTGIRKKDFDNYLKEAIGYFNIESYFRWIATLENPFKNINDLTSEISESKIKEITIKYKNLEWSLNYGSTDVEGHSGSKNADFPHFHIQMLFDGKPFINFNDYHIPFTKEDLFKFELMNEANDLVEFRNDYGEGISIIEDSEILKEFEKTVRVAESEENALFHSSSIIQRPNNKTMSGEIIEEIMKESKETKVPIRHLFRKYFPDVEIITKIEPGKGVPEMKRRIPRNKKK
jgi:hypothetical protein